MTDEDNGHSPDQLHKLPSYPAVPLDRRLGPSAPEPLPPSPEPATLSWGDYRRFWAHRLWAFLRDCRGVAGRALAPFTTRLEDWGDKAANAMKDSILDLGCPGRDVGVSKPAPLPPVEALRLLNAMAPRLEAAMLAVAIAINEDVDGDRPDETARRIQDIFDELKQATVDAAIDQRIEAFVGPESERKPLEEWARKYRQMVVEDDLAPVEVHVEE
jgi:hypothetical protein